MAFEWLFEGKNAARLGEGLLLTAQISLISVAASCVLGTLFGLVLRSRNRLVRFVGRFYLETIRIVPILVWLFGLYFGLSVWTGIHIGGFWVCVWVFSLWGVAEMGDLVRGALESIEKHQVESGLAPGEPGAGIPLHRAAAKHPPRIARRGQPVHAHDQNQLARLAYRRDRSRQSRAANY